MSMNPQKTATSARGPLLFLLIFCAAATLTALYGAASRAAPNNASEISASVRQFSGVLATVQRSYAEPVDSEKIIYDGAIPGMLHVLDPHSNFFDPRQYDSFREEQEGKYYGVGMQVAARDHLTVVVSPFVGSPAYKAGIRPGDSILKVDGKPCEGLSTTDVAGLLKGPKGTEVHITLGRQGWDAPIEVSIIRDEIPRPGVEYSGLLKPGIGYVRVPSFNETTDADLTEALHQINYPRLDALILDLRGNPGGLLNEAVGMAGMFLEKGQLVVYPPRPRVHRAHLQSGARKPGHRRPVDRADQRSKRLGLRNRGRRHPGSRPRPDRWRNKFRKRFGPDPVSAERRYRVAADHRPLLHSQWAPDPARVQRRLALRLSLQSQAARPSPS
jgi:C-terminal peptidase prc